MAANLNVFKTSKKIAFYPNHFFSFAEVHRVRYRIKQENKNFDDMGTLKLTKESVIVALLTISAVFTYLKLIFLKYVFKHLSTLKHEKLSYFNFKNDIRIVRSKSHVTSTLDVSLCVRDSSTSSSIISSSELLDKLAKLFHSESLDSFLNSEFPLNSKV